MCKNLHRISTTSNYDSQKSFTAESAKAGFELGAT